MRWKQFFYPGWMQPMFRCVLQCCVASTVLVLKFVGKFCRGWLTARSTGVISWDKYTEVRCAPLTASVPTMARCGERLQDSAAWSAKWTQTNRQTTMRVVSTTCAYLGKTVRDNGASSSPKARSISCLLQRWGLASLMVTCPMMRQDSKYR